MTKDLRHFAFVQLDVFSSRPFEGNSLAVFPDGRGLSDQQMQALAREMNLSETTFILPREQSIEKERGVRVRIFTVQEELPFAGHPTLGTAFWLRASTGAGEVALELNVGKVPVRFEETAGQPVFGEMTQVEPKVRSDPRSRNRGARHQFARRRHRSFAADPDGFHGTAFHHRTAARAGGDTPSAGGPRAFRRIPGAVGRRKVFLFRDPRDGRSRGPPARPHDVLQRRRSGHRLRRRLRRRVDGGARRGPSPTNACSSSRESRCCVPAGFLCARRAWITEWLTCAWEEMLWKFFAEKFFSEPRSRLP